MQAGILIKTLKEFQPTHFIDDFYLIKVVNIVLLRYLLVKVGSFSELFHFGRFKCRL